MNAIKLMQMLRRVPPQAWDAIVPHGPSIRIHPFGSEVSLNTQPIPPHEDDHLVAISLARHLATLASTADALGNNGGSILLREIDDWCGTGWPHRWFRPPHPPHVGDPTPWPRPNWTPSDLQFVGGLALAELANRMSDGELRDAIETGANKLLETALA
jgi:hypothetical protein